MTASKAFCWIVVLATTQDPVAGRKPIPEASKLTSAEKLVREVLKDDYAKTGPAERKVLAKKLYQQGLEPQDDPTVTYVLLKNSRVISSELGDVETGLAAIDVLAKAFEVDAIKEKQAFLLDATKSSRLPATQKAAAEAWIALSTEALKAGAFETAISSAEAAIAAAKLAKDIPLLGKAELARKDVESSKLRTERLKVARETLIKDAQDPAANQILGLYECVTLGKWAVGLPFLAKGSDPALKEAATRDLAAPKEAADQLSVADAWWSIAEKESGDAKDQMRRRAGYWYLKARGGLSGLHRSKADKRLENLKDLKVEEESPNLVGHWTFEEGMGAAAADHAGTAGPMTLVKGASWAEGHGGKALDISAGAYATVEDLPALNFDVDSFSVACFIRLRKTTSCRLINKWQLPGNAGWLFDANAAVGGQAVRPGSLRVRVSDGKVNIDHAVDAGLQVETWTHVAFVLDRKAGEIRFFVRGEPIESPRSLGKVGSVSCTAPLAVGYVPGTPAGNHLNGSVDDLRVYRRALSPGEVKELATRR